MIDEDEISRTGIVLSQIPLDSEVGTGQVDWAEIFSKTSIPGESSQVLTRPPKQGPVKVNTSTGSKIVISTILEIYVDYSAKLKSQIYYTHSVKSVARF